MEDAERHWIELNCAVLNELTKILDGSTDAPAIDIQRLLDDSEYEMDAEIQMGALDDDDWRDIKTSRSDRPRAPDSFVRLYDKSKRTMYHVKRGSSGISGLEGGIHSNDASACISPPAEEVKPESIRKQDVDEVLSRLTPENGAFGPRGYQDWTAKKLQSRFSYENDIPGYASLCEPCHQMFTQSLLFHEQIYWCAPMERSNKIKYTEPFHEVFALHTNMRAFRASASAVCHFCTLLDASGTKNYVNHDEEGAASYYLQIDRLINRLVTVTLRAIGHPGKELFVGYECLSLQKPSTLKHRKTEAPEIIDLARMWLNRCLSEDGESCTTSTRFLPSRLVKITTTKNSLDTTCVVLQEEVPASVQYLTLSHCWGTLEMVSLTKSTYEDYRVQLPIPSLSKTFREALQVTAWLGYRYIWIDSLCIQQDSDSDWKREAAMMGAIYRHSTCTIAATGAKDGNGGLFFERSALAFEDCLLYKGKQNLFACSDYHWPKPLSSRAWAVQERYLSPRVLSFGSDKISWSCGRTEASEGPDAHRLHLDDRAFPKLLDPLTDKITVSSAWINIVSRYSRCNLTYWKDRWPAFQGLSNEVAKAQNWTIVHGLRSHLLGRGELLWEAYHPETGTIDLGEPSWSWLNIKSEVHLNHYRNFENSNAAILLQEFPFSAGDDSRCDIKDGIIRIEAHMIKIKSIIQSGSGGLNRLTLATTNPHVPDLTLKGCWFPDSIPIRDDGLWALQIFKTDYGSGMFSLRGLVVVVVEGRPGFWRRVGAYEVDADLEETSGSVYPWTHEKTTIYLI
ncbi:hypothetical protein M3J09_012944 [Ascochyta lentis]